MWALDNPVEGLNNIHLFKSNYGPFASVKALRVFPSQRLFILVAARMDGSHCIVLWDDVEAWLPDNKGTYGHPIEMDVMADSSKYPEHMGMRYKQAIQEDKLVWIDYPSIRVGPSLPAFVPGCLRVCYAIFYQNMFTVYVRQGPDREMYYIGSVAPISDPNQLSWITIYHKDDEAVKAQIQKELKR